MTSTVMKRDPAALREDLDDNNTIYGKKYSNKEIVQTGVPVPKSASELISLFNKYSSAKSAK